MGGISVERSASTLLEYPRVLTRSSQGCEDGGLDPE
jgi:hypothetical protein